MRDLIILGVGVHAREMVEIVERVNRQTPAWDLLGFIADEKDAERVGRELNGYPVLGTPLAVSEYPDAWFVPGYATRHSIDVPYDRLTTLIDPSAFVSRTATIGRGCVLYPGCFVGLNAVLGDRVFALSGCAVNHDDVLGDDVAVASGAALAGGVNVGAGCYLGQACTVRQHVRIGANSMIGMGAVVLKDVPPNSVMVGNPARRLSSNDRPGA